MSRQRLTTLQAIDWAVNEQEVDIVSMSFGWPKEDESGSISAAIQRAYTTRSGRILFFAAASNSGGDYAEWFPASHDFVTAVRATTHEGQFDAFNAPPDYAGADVIGTLGVDVPGASNNQDEPERSATGTSYATPIAAAFGALVLDATKVNPTTNNTVTHRRIYDKLRSRYGMREMFRAPSMSRKVGERSWYLSAMPFCSLSEVDRRTVMDNAALNA